jgi:hypothetical protein
MSEPKEQGLTSEPKEPVQETLEEDSDIDPFEAFMNQNDKLVEEQAPTSIEAP